MIIFIFNYYSLIFKPLTLRQARAICKDFQTLIGRSFDQTMHWDNIECVAVTPYDEINKWIFACNYAEMKCPELALDYYAGHFYGVSVIARLKSNPGFCSCRDIKTYLREFNIAPGNGIDELYEA